MGQFETSEDERKNGDFEAISEEGWRKRRQAQGIKSKIGNSVSNFHFGVRAIVGKSFAKGSHFVTRLRL